LNIAIIASAPPAAPSGAGVVVPAGSATKTQLAPNFELLQIHPEVVVLHDPHPEGNPTGFPVLPKAKHPVKLALIYY